LKLNDEEDDATSSFKEHTVSKADAFDQGLCSPGQLEWAAEPFDQSSFDLNFLGGFEVSLAIVLTFLWVAQDYDSLDLSKVSSIMFCLTICLIDVTVTPLILYSV